jgi:predicted enzyme related to lactoylglutathione lyase
MLAKTWGERLRHALISFELPAKNVAEAKTSYSQVFGWSLIDFRQVMHARIFEISK